MRPQRRGWHGSSFDLGGVLSDCWWLMQAVQSFGSEGALLQLLTQGLRGVSTQMLGLDVGPRPMAVMPDIKVRSASM